jgi:hypothetical protein
MSIGIVVLVASLTSLPALTLGPLVEQLTMIRPPLTAPSIPYLRVFYIAGPTLVVPFIPTRLPFTLS